MLGNDDSSFSKTGPMTLLFACTQDTVSICPALRSSSDRQLTKVRTCTKTRDNSRPGKSQYTFALNHANSATHQVAQKSMMTSLSCEVADLKASYESITATMLFCTAVSRRAQGRQGEWILESRYKEKARSYRQQADKEDVEEWRA